MFKRLLIISLISFVFAVPTFAQDVTPEPTAEPTPVVVVTPPPTFVNADNAISVSTLLYGIIIAVLAGGGAGAVILRFGTSKANVDALEKLYQSASPETQQIIRERFVELEGIVKRLLDIADKATDGQPNTESTGIDPNTQSHA